MLTVTLIIGVLVSLAACRSSPASRPARSLRRAILLCCSISRRLCSASSPPSIGTHVIVSILAPWLSLYGTRRLTVSILVGLVLATGIGYLRSELVSEMLIWAGLGYIVPGLIAHQWYRQGFWPTMLMLAIAASITRTLALLTMAVLR